MEKEENIQALLDARQAGKTRFIGCSADNESALWTVESDLFDTLQTSYNLVDQSARRDLLPQAKAQNMGVIIKRPIANAAWGAETSPSNYAHTYFMRAKEMLAEGPIPGAPDDRILLALGYVFAQDLADTMIVGTLNPRHLAANIEMVNRLLPIDAQVVEGLNGRFDHVEEN